MLPVRGSKALLPQGKLTWHYISSNSTDYQCDQIGMAAAGKLTYHFNQ
jgi:hypothetical protein